MSCARVQRKKLDPLPELLRVGKIHQKPSGCMAVLAVTVGLMPRKNYFSVAALEAEDAEKEENI